jgi:uncharacterized protein DUF4136
MQRTISISVIVLFCCLTVVLAFGQHVTFDYDHNANFSKYKTFSWIKKPVTRQDPFLQQRIINAVNAQLQSKGLQPVDNNGDLGVAVNVATQEKHTLNTFYDGFGPWAWGLGGATTTVETYTEGTIVADLFDAGTRKVIWRATGSKEVSSKPEKETKEVEKAIEKMFRNYPPRGL